MGPSGSGDPHGVGGTRSRAQSFGKKSLHTSRSVFHTKIALRGATFGRSICCWNVLESARGAGSKSHATPIGARTTAIHLVNALGGKKVRSRRARDIKLPLAPLSSSHLMPPVPMLPSQVKHFGLLFRGVRVDIAQGHRGDTHGHREALLSRTPVLFCSSDALRAHGQTLICTLRRLQDRRRPWRRSWAAGHASLMPPSR